MEEWKIIKEFPMYEVSNKGRIKSNVRSNSRILKPIPNSRGYLRVQLLDKDGKKRRVFIHRLVANAFVVNIKNKPCVNHIDNNPLNNTAENLEWVTHQENMDWMAIQGRNKRTKEWINNLKKSLEVREKAVIATPVYGGKSFRIKSVNDSKRWGFEPSCVSNCCNGIRRTHKGHTFRFEHESTVDGR